MSTATWEPSPKDFNISAEHVNELLNWIQSQSAMQTTTCPLAWVNHAAKSSLAWQNLAETLDDAALRSLIEFFTQAEEENGWNLKDKSVVISLFKVLRKRTGTDKELVKWVKANTSNKFLPFGAVL